MSRIRAGDLRHTIMLRRKATAQDTKGGFETLWSTVASMGAKVEGIDGREALIGMALQGVSHFKITIRYRADVLTSDQIVLSTGTELNVVSATDPDGQRRSLMILADTASVQDEAA
jgi:SPP1 family predicted phage head-tail adaptor